MAAQIWWITHVSSLRFSCSACTRTLPFKRSIERSRGSKSRLCAGHLSLCTLFVTIITSVFSPRDMMCNPVQTSYRDLHGYDEEEEPNEWRHFDTSCFLEWLHFEFLCVCMKTIERVLLCLFSPYLMVCKRQSTRNYTFYQIRQLPCRARGDREHNLYSHLRSAWTVLYMETCSEAWNPSRVNSVCLSQFNKPTSNSPPTPFYSFGSFKCKSDGHFSRQHSEPSQTIRMSVVCMNNNNTSS